MNSVKTWHYTFLRCAAAIAVAICFFAFVAAPAVNAQEVSQVKPNYEQADKFSSEILRKFLYGTSVSPNWIEKTDRFWYSFRNNIGLHYYIVDPVKKTKLELWDPARFAAALSARLQKKYDSKNIPTLTLKFVKNETAVEFDLENVKWEFTLATYKLDSIGRAARADSVGGGMRGGQRGGPPGGARGRAANRAYSPDSTLFVYAKNFNLYLATDADTIGQQITFTGVSRFGFGGDTSNARTRASVNWSEDSKRFSFQRTDTRMTVGKDLYLINDLGTPQNPRPILSTYPYSMPGEPNGDDELYYYDAPLKNLKQIKVEKWPNQNVSSVRWGNISDDLYFHRVDRTMDWYEVCYYKPSTDEVKILIQEHMDKSTIETKGINFINKFSEIIWWSERSGWGHFYLYDSAGNLKNPITTGDFQASGVVRIDTAKRILYFNGNGDYYPGKPANEWPYYSHIFRVNFDGTGLKLLSPEDAMHSVNMAPTNNFFVDNFSRVDMAPKSVLRDNMGNKIMDLEEADTKALLEYGWQFPERFVVKSADGITDIYGVMFKPFDFDPKKKYPIIAHVYPGPQTESITFTFSPTNGDMALAQLGFIVIHIGNRGGSPQRSLAYHRYEMEVENAREYGLADKKAGIEQLAARFSFIDIDKVGIYGHSGGGFMTAAALLSPPYNEFFKVGVSSSGNHDNNIYNQPWTENQFGGEWIADTTGRGAATTRRGAGGRTANPDTVQQKMVFSAKTATNIEVAPNLKGHLLLVTGTMDNNVHPANTIRLVNALIRAGKRFDFMIMPGQAHGYGQMQSYFTKMLWDYFCEHLLGDSDKKIDMTPPIRPQQQPTIRGGQ